MSETTASVDRGALADGGEALLTVDDLKTYFFSEDCVTSAVDGVTFNVRAG